jgi:hypothetical protein
MNYRAASRGVFDPKQNKSPHQSPHVVMTSHHLRWYSVSEDRNEGNGMSDIQSSTKIHDEPNLYEIRLKGHLEARWADRFESMTITLAENGQTLLTGPVIDQAALHGLLKKIRDLGLPLISVNRVQPGQNETHLSHSKKENESE